MRFYSAWNAADPDGAVENMAADVEYWDTIYEKPFVGRESVREYFAKAARVLGPAVKFVVDGLSPAEDGSAVGVKWHCELDDGTPLPNSRGCSFYELRDSGRVIFRARDFVEPSVKPGAATLYLLRAVLPLVRLAAKLENNNKGKDDGGGGKGGGPSSSGSGDGGGSPSGNGNSGSGNSLAFLSSGLLHSSSSSTSSPARGSVFGGGGGGRGGGGEEGERNDSNGESLALAFESGSSDSGGASSSFSPSSGNGISGINNIILTSLSLFGGGDGNEGGSGTSSTSSSSSRAALSPPPPPRSKSPGSLTINSALVWLFYVAYLSFVFFSRELPGSPVLETPPEVLTEVAHESWTFYYFVPVFNLIADATALPENLRIPDLPEHPASEALFNFVNAWSMMMLPVMLSEASEALPSRNARESGDVAADEKSSLSWKGSGNTDVDGAEREKSSPSNAFKWWLGVQFLTNVFMIPYMALRAREGGPGNDLVPEAWSEKARQRGSNNSGSSSSSIGVDNEQKNTSFPSWTPAIGLGGISVGFLSILWALYGRPEVAAELGKGLSGDFSGDSLEGRWAWAANALSTNRATWAFALDASLYSVWQAAMLKQAGPLERFVPFFGMAAYLMRVRGGGGGSSEEKEGEEIEA